MGWLDYFKKKEEQPDVVVRKMRKTRPARRSFASGDMDNLFGNFSGSSMTADGELLASLDMMRARSRKLAMDSDYARKFLALVKANVIGASGIRLMPQVRGNDGALDESDNRVLERGWQSWGKRDNCTVGGDLSWLDVQQLFVETVARDGECLVRLVRNYGDNFGFALQVLEADALDSQMNRELDGGSYITLGIEKDKFGKPVAYHLRARAKTGGCYAYNGGNYERVPASDIIHAFRAERPSQSRGIPWLNTAIRRLRMLAGFEEAELVAARVAASKMGFYVTPTGDEYVGDSEDDDGTLVSTVEAGTFEELPAGTTVETFDPAHPASGVADFVKVVLRGAAAGLGVSYNSLANDLEGVNFSSIRSGVLEEREQWRVLQQWVIEVLHARVYEAWLKEALLRDAFAVHLPPAKFDKFARVSWIPRGWAWVDPLKDQKAAQLGLQLGVTTRAEIAATQGRRLEDVFEQLQREHLLAEQYGLTVEHTVIGDDDEEELDNE
jgi:lambda family phage portal protein